MEEFACVQVVIKALKLKDEESLNFISLYLRSPHVTNIFSLPPASLGVVEQGSISWGCVAVMVSNGRQW